MPRLRWFALCAFGLLAVCGCGDGGGGHGSDLEGTWVNPAYAGLNGPPAKMVFTKNTLAFYTKPADATPYGTGSWAVEGEWAAAEGRYFQCELTYGPESIAHWLVRMFDLNTFEAQVSADTYPTTVSGGTGDYGVWTRRF